MPFRHYNKHNEWSFDFRERKTEMVPFYAVVIVGIAYAGIMAAIELAFIKYVWQNILYLFL